MTQVFISSRQVLGGSIEIVDPLKVHHLKDVLRLNPGSRVVAIDEHGKAYHTLIKEIVFSKVALEIVSVSDKPYKAYSLTVACAIPKQAKFDDIVDKLTQLGVDMIIPLITKRVVVKLDKKAQDAKLSRWRKIAQSASLQSQRRGVPHVQAPVAFKELIACVAGYDLRLIPALIDERRPLRQALEGNPADNIIVLIGPEGDFTPEEMQCAKIAGFVPVTLGAEVLRVDTAAAAAAAYIKFYYENR